MTRDEIVECYRQAVIQYGRAIEKGRARTANKAGDEARRMLELLQADSPGGERALLVLLDDDDRAVRCWAAADTLALAPARALAVLRAIATDGRGPIRLEAEILFRQWKTYGRIGEDVPMPPLDDDLPPA